MNKKQREALAALRDVMCQHDISVVGGNYDGSIELYVGHDIVAGYNNELYDVNINILDQLEQETE